MVYAEVGGEASVADIAAAILADPEQQEPGDRRGGRSQRAVLDDLSARLAANPSAEADPALVRALRPGDEAGRDWTYGSLAARTLLDLADQADLPPVDWISIKSGFPGPVSSPWRECAALLAAAPAAALTQEFASLLPFLLVIGGCPPPPVRDTAGPLLARLLALPAFRAVAMRTCMLVREESFDDLSADEQFRWASQLGSTWIYLHGHPPTPTGFARGELLVARLASPAMDWALPPLAPGAWTEPGLADAAALLRMICEAPDRWTGRLPPPLQHHCDRVRCRPIACYDEGLLVELQGYTQEGWPGLLSVIVHPSAIAVANGDSWPLHRFNRRVSPRLDTAEARRDYALLFLNWTRAEGARFHPLEDVGEIRHRAIEPEQLSEVEPLLSRVRDEGRDGERWRIGSAISHSGSLYRASFLLAADGAVEMIEEFEALRSLPLVPEVQDGFLLRLARPGEGGENVKC